MSDGIRLSPKHGVNPSLSQCFYCGGDKNEVVLAGLMKGGHDPEAPRKAVWSMEPCDQCTEFMKQGIILIEVDEAKSKDLKNPYRTGSFAVIKEEALLDMLNTPELVERIRKQRFTFVPIDAWDKMGLPRGEKP